MRDKDWDTLVWSLQHRNCILLLGSDVAGVADGGGSLQSELCAALRSELSTPVSPTATFPHVAQRFSDEIGRNDLEREVAQFYRTRRPPSPIHSTLASLPFYLVISAAHDDLLAEALRARNKPPVTARYNYKGNNPGVVTMGQVESPLIYHLYGHSTEPESLVLTEGDLLDFLVAIVSDVPPLPHNIKSELQKKGKSFLFVGFGIRQWYVRILLHVLKLKRAETRSFALEPPVPLPDDDQTILYYKTGYRIEVFQHDVAEFVSELARRCAAEEAALPAGTAPAVTPDAPKVFICHASENKDVANQIHDRFLEAGLNPWFDRARLEGGAAFDREIEQTLGETDYFVVVQSEALQRKPFSYVNKEISLALDRQRYVRSGFRFIIPVVVDDSPLLPELREYQAVPLRSGGDIDQLISTIRRDHQRRLRQ
ncbi:MAG TPA: toll/interleukin-1 receptor domain-containing protein [Thermoanaerobaculia bacterium]|nr:toll/interleukin-1 receptor domain-containing protein [Thermoanaerobaculia bacterium]